ncbi:MAG: hypothetical protein COV75_07110 [Candidatus Omnitrophica bacterium CG11_big_fil_rev_8_21_14_0_20_63_9]|nr:MAG: hypothetical protein COV75_07110 [Candidatus Omnitrophica bacterium CG11_big_fil_rev_8_21_14_0_20_63_9]
MSGRRAALGLVAALLVGCGMGQAFPSTSSTNAIGLGVGYQPPPFSAADLNGQQHDLAAYKGRVVVLHFWASWCPYCRSEIPELTELYQQANKSVQVIAVSSDEDVAVLKQFIAEKQLPYPIIADHDMPRSISEQYGISGIPVTYVIGKDGRIAERLHGASEIIEAVTRVLAGPSST